MRPDLLVSFSAGETSALMAFLIKNDKTLNRIFKVHYVIANTGQEDERSLMFADKCDKHFDLNLTWVEADIQQRTRSGTKHKVVSFETATRGDSLFRAMCSKYGIPNLGYPHCSRELKKRPLFSWRKENFNKYAVFAVGIRTDEIDRMSVEDEKEGVLYPLVSLYGVSKSDVNAFWAKQPFRLEIPPHRGNCLWCWKKSDSKLEKVYRESPEAFDVPISLERDFATIRPERGYQSLFRKNRNTEQLIAKFDGSTQSNGCESSCDGF